MKLATVCLPVLALLWGTAYAAPSGSSKAKGPSIIGEWLFRNDEAEVRIFLKGNGRFIRVIKTAGGSETTSGTYTAKDGKLVARPEGEGETITLNYRLVGENEMEMTAEDGTGLRLIRQESASPEDDPAKSPVSPVPTGKGKATSGKHPLTLVLKRMAEPREKAFSILAPRGWVVEGGMTRWPPEVAGAKNAIEAKLDFTIKKDAPGTVMARWLPDIMYADTSGSAVQGMFAPGSEYNGCIALPKMTPAAYLVNAVLPRAFPNARNVKVVSRQSMPKLTEPYVRWARAIGLPPDMTYTGSGVTVEYDEGGVRYRQLMMAVVEDFGPMGMGLWKSKSTMTFRAPAAEFKAWAPVLKILQESVKINGQWLMGELKGAAQRAGKLGELQTDIQEIDRAIVEHRQKTNAEINHQMFLNLTGQEDYINPFTKEVETGSNEWNYRWTNPAGDVIYTDDQNYDPRRDPNLQRQDFKKTPPRRPRI